MRITSGLSEDGMTRTLYRFDGHLDAPRLEGLDRDDSNMLLMYLDVEATGLDKDGSDEIVDFAYVIFEANRETGRVLSIRREFESLNDSKKNIPEEVERLTGITNEMKKGHSIDWNMVNSDLSRVDAVVAHNARYDRRMVLKYSDDFAKKHWLCSMDLIPWLTWGHPGKKLEYLAQDHGFFFTGHRALVDAKVGVYLLLTGSYEGDTYLKHMLLNFVRPKLRIIARGLEFDYKDQAKAAGAFWNGEYWYFDVNKGSPEHLRVDTFFKESNGRAGRQEVAVIPPLERYSY